MAKNLPYHKCPHCGGNLDHGERCDCLIAKEQYKPSNEKRILANYAALQQEGDFACPRCGQARMAPELIMNDISAHENIYICKDCAENELYRKLLLKEPKPLSRWWICSVVPLQKVVARLFEGVDYKCR